MKKEETHQEEAGGAEMKKAKVINYVSDEREEYLKVEEYEKARKDERIATLEEVLKWLPNNVKLKDLDSDANVEGITYRLRKWLEQQLKEAKG